MTPIALQTWLAAAAFIIAVVVGLRLYRSNRRLRLERGDSSAAVREIEQRLQHSEEQFRTIVENAPVMIDAFDESGRCVLWNREAEKNLGWTREEIRASEDPLAMCYPDEAKRNETLQAILKADGKFREYEPIAKDGSTRVQLWADFRLPDGTLISVGYDITENRRAENALAESEEKYRSIFTGARDGIVGADDDGYILYCNSEYESHTGRSIEELRKMRVWEIRPKEFQERSRDLFYEKLRKIGQLGPVEQVFEKPNGDRVTVELHARRVKIGTRWVNLGITRDVTERKRTEEILKESEERYANLFHYSNDGILVQDLDGNIIDVNEKILEQFGYSKDEVLALNVSDLYRSEVEEQAVAALKTVIEEGFVSLEVDLRRKSGEVFPAEVSGSLFEASGKRLVQGVVRDITDRRSAEAALRASEAKYRLLVESAGMPICSYDREGRLMLINEIGAKNLGKPAKELIGTSLWDQFPKDAADFYFARFKKVMDLGGPDYYEDFVDIPIGKRWFWSILQPVKGADGATVGVQIVSHDITERKKAEAEREQSKIQLRALAGRLNEIREQESANISREIHDELGQRLTVLKMDLSWIQRRIKELETKGDTGGVIERLKAMSKDIDETVNGVRRIATQLRPVILDNLGLVGALEWQAQEFESRTGITCDFRLGRDGYSLDAERSTAVFRIFQEILTNVARHSGASRVTIELNNVDDVLAMDVCDNGRGITEQEIQGPLALGILGMQERAQLCGGEVNIQRDESCGTRAVVRIPLAREMSRAATSPEEPRAGEGDV